MSYSNPDQRFYHFPNVAFGTSSTQKIRGPKGKAGRLIATHVSATVLFTAVTTSGRVDIGTAGTANAYQSLTLGTLAAGAALASDDSNASSSVVTNTLLDLPADTDVMVSFIAPTGGSPAGTATVGVCINWAD
jgi:hypothetical protein